MPKENSRILSLNELKEAINNCRQGNKVIVLTNGCFDILHSGHLHLLNSAKASGDILVVGINSDRSVKKLKGPDRPLVSEKERAELLANLRVVDFVTIFDEDTASNLLNEIKPDIYIKGGDYNPDNLPEAPVVASFGGRIKFIELAAGKSSTGLIDKIKTL
jgi:rfaE bifunctional protein nucleotidyltransferase chain/domain